MTIGEALKEIRLNMHLTQGQMVEGTYISVSHYSKIESGNQEIKAIDLFRLLDQRRISITALKNKVDEDKNNKLDILSDELVKAFYKPDIEKLKEIKAEIDTYNDAEELQIRAEIAVAGLTNQINGIKTKLSSKIIKYLLENKQWTQDPDMLRMIGNSIWIINIDSLNLIMAELLHEYADIDKETLDVQKRIASIYINYLHVLYQNQEYKIADKYVKILKQLPPVPELTLFKMLTLYYEALFDKDEDKAKEIINPLKNIVPKIVKYLPVK
ncbi:XRE family transcriptional regulator [uncultured Lactobacillus sp.]|uniref:helix-turn-helix domain-containing protein n=1 Tax=uncultured Lactobacillus sp. TaxID=153152 RepID=UPI00280516A1|nr:XRE family transcriptional regulator [uncultured Lactobacillus sp.]